MYNPGYTTTPIITNTVPGQTILPPGSVVQPIVQPAVVQPSVIVQPTPVVVPPPLFVPPPIIGPPPLYGPPPFFGPHHHMHHGPFGFHRRGFW